MNNPFEPLNEEDVVSINYAGHQFVIANTTFTVVEFVENLRLDLDIHRLNDQRYHWLGMGIACRMLQPGSNRAGWRTGKVRIHLEFCPDDELPPEPETIQEQTQPPNYTESLDGIRQEIAHNS